MDAFVFIFCVSVVFDDPRHRLEVFHRVVHQTNALQSISACTPALLIETINRFRRIEVAGYGTAMLLSYFIGQHYHPIRYDVKGILTYFALTLALFAVSQMLPIEDQWLRMGANTLLLALFVAYIIKRDLPLKQLPVIGKFFR